MSIYLDVLNAALDSAVDARVRLHHGNQAGVDPKLLPTREYMAGLRAVRDVEDALEPLRKAAGAKGTRAWETAMADLEAAGEITKLPESDAPSGVRDCAPPSCAEVRADDHITNEGSGACGSAPESAQLALTVPLRASGPSEEGWSYAPAWAREKWDSTGRLEALRNALRALTLDGSSVKRPCGDENTASTEWASGSARGPANTHGHPPNETQRPEEAQQ